MNPPLHIRWIPEPSPGRLLVTGTLLLVLGKAGWGVLKGLAVWAAIGLLVAAILILAIGQDLFSPAPEGARNANQG